MANMYAMILARYKMFPEVKENGIANIGRLVVLVSEDSHYSFAKGAMFMGMGTKAVVKVKTDNNGCMDPVELEKSIIDCISQGSKPFLVCCTAGTTVLSAFDPIDRVIAVSKKYGLWVHVDAALGGTVLFSRKHRHLMKGIEDADSMTCESKIELD